jgi:hypothetical protein
MGWICNGDIHHYDLEGEEKAGKIESSTDDRNNPVDASFRCEPEDKNTRRDEDTSYKSNFEADLGGDIAACFRLMRGNMILLIEAVYDALNDDPK